MLRSSDAMRGWFVVQSGKRDLGTHLLDGVSTGVSAISAHHKEHVNTPHVDALDNLPKVSAPAAGAKDGTSL